MQSRWLLLVAFIGLALAKEHTVKVKGIVICDKRRQTGVTVELWERDSLDPNDLLKTVMTDSEGRFEVEGKENEVGNIEPFLVITHSCHVKKAGCKRKSEYVIPSKFIDREDAYDMTYVNLDIISAVDKEKC